MYFFRFSGGTAFSRDKVNFYCTFHQLLHCNLEKKDMYIGSVVELTLSSSVDTYKIDYDELIDNYDYFYENAYTESDDNSINIEIYEDKKKLAS